MVMAGKSLLLVASQNKKVSPHHWTHHILKKHTSRSQVITDVEASSLGTDFYNIRRCCAIYQDRGVIDISTQQYNLWTTTLIGLGRYPQWWYNSTFILGILVGLFLLWWNNMNRETRGKRIYLIYTFIPRFIIEESHERQQAGQKPAGRNWYNWYRGLGEPGLFITVC